ncbi:MAG: tRNA glutamyl-Q(34) synthetase GluQRS [Pseudomonadota bacterium]|nr:tRNA glutamyl-Q(34) synthetase GluQRS [Pseudomonadota bacterium]
MPTRPPYIGRFAPSPTGRLHAGSVLAAVASYLDARVHRGRWLVRIEDVDEARSAPGAAEAVLALLQQLGMQWDGEVIWQSRRGALYQAAFEQLGQRTYPCGCNRREIVDSRLGTAPDGSAVYPGTCRQGLGPGKSMRSLRVRVPEPGADLVAFAGRFAGPLLHHLAIDAGDFVLKRADGYWAYQLAVVVDDADQGVTDVVRGADLLDSTPRQIYLQRLLGLPTPRYLHVPVLRNAHGEKLSKQTGAAAVTPHDEAQAVAALLDAARGLGLPLGHAASLAAFWDAAIPAWAALLAAHGERL